MNFEKKIYEFLGIKTFRKLTIKLFYYFNLLNPKLYTMSLEERKKYIYSEPTYFINKKNCQGLEKFKKSLLYNFLIHLFGLILSIIGLVIVPIQMKSIQEFLIIFSIIHTYCMMLQRYNYIRIEKVLNKSKNHSCKQNETIKELKKYKQMLIEYQNNLIFNNYSDKNIITSNLEEEKILRLKH